MLDQQPEIGKHAPRTSFRATRVDLGRDGEGADLSESSARDSWLEDIPQPVRPGKHYERAPIVEAVIELLCDVPPETTTDDLQAAIDSENFASTERQVEVTSEVSIEEVGSSGEVSSRTIGYLFRNERHAVQARLNGYAFSWLGKYQDWQSLFDEAERYWYQYVERIKPTRVTRAGVRYINRILVPEPSIEIGDYLRVGIEIPAYMPQEVSSYLLRFEVPLPKLNAVVTIMSAVEPPRPDGTGLILDIDAWRPVDINLSDAAERKDLDVLLEDLRLAKNFAFESSITDATRRLIE